MVVHLPVLLQEVVLGLDPKPGETILDGTVGGGGHSEALCRKMEGKGTFVCMDADADAIARSRERLTPPAGGCACEFHFVPKNFRFLDEALASVGITEIHRALFDLGLSSFALEESGRGFSFQKDEPLLMTFAKIPPPAGTPFTKGRTESETLTAYEIVNTWSQEDIEKILREFGEEWQARRIAGALITARKVSPIVSTAVLAEIIEKAIRRRGRIHPATKTFQALRIAVNDEYGALKEALPKAWERLAKGGRLAVISFQSGEDRIVKQQFRAWADEEKGARITKKPIVAGEEERKGNPRARSAKLRIIEKK
ncbi:MAG: 16S rRNA (cytosine(1402)-N(4))-methyltransferase RsmH [bacterium]|nr:16S rRNA (cytosine(1402)-N(4))-methyltransferase RsmH [bacterium]